MAAPLLRQNVLTQTLLSVITLKDMWLCHI